MFIICFMNVGKIQEDEKILHIIKLNRESRCGQVLRVIAEHTG